MTGTTCTAEHPVYGTTCTQPAGPAHGDRHEDLDGSTWVTEDLDEVVVDDAEVVEQPDVPAEVWVLRGSLGIGAAGVVLIVLAFGLAVASVWTADLLSDRLFETALLCGAAGFVAVLAGRAGIRSARGADEQPVDEVSS